MATPLLSDLREPPVAGKFYMVPTVEYKLRGLTTAWPVIGPRHEDTADLNFPYLHYHLDGRFLSDRMLEAITYWGVTAQWAVATTILADPRCINTSEPVRAEYGSLPARPTLRQRKCRHSIFEYPASARAALIKRVGEDRIGNRLGNPAKAIHTKDGRTLCPHRKVDLSSLPRDAEGMVNCPLHGPRVNCSQVAA